MLPNTVAEEYKHRRHKRQMEVVIIIESIKSLLKKISGIADNNLNILEFGSGDGFQVPYLKSLGNVIASDIHASHSIKLLEGIDFVACSINNTPFRDGQFDIIFSNHVIEHLDDITGAFREMHRIGKASCIYAFSVPTNIWLLLHIPTQYYNKVRRVINSRKINKIMTVKRNADHSCPIIPKISGYLNMIMPKGHGVTSNFIECYHNFKIENWRRLFSDNCFSMAEVIPLLLYGPSEWPIIPTSRCKTNLCSSVLFLMKK